MKEAKTKKIYVCPQCESSNLIYDYAHAEIYCKQCGLVVVDRSNAKYFDIRKIKHVPRKTPFYKVYLGIIDFINNGSKYHYELMGDPMQWLDVIMDDLEP